MTKNPHTPQDTSPTPSTDSTDQEPIPTQEQNSTQNQALEAYLAGYERINSVFDGFHLPSTSSPALTAETFMPFPPDVSEDVSDVPHDFNDHAYVPEMYDVDKE